MPIDHRKAAKALKAVMSTASSGSDTPLASLGEDAASVQRGAEILVLMQYAIVTNGNIRLTASREAVKHG